MMFRKIWSLIARSLRDMACGICFLLGIEEFSAATGQERHGTIVDYDIFTSVTMPDRNYPPAMIKVKGKKNKRD